jgi:hypothetical protein
MEERTITNQHSGVAYLTTRKLTQKFYRWLPRDIEEGELLHPYYGVTYGSIGPAGVAVTFEAGVTPFYEVPRDGVRMVGID